MALKIVPGEAGTRRATEHRKQLHMVTHGCRG
jgi:hypothetical protein